MKKIVYGFIILLIAIGGGFIAIHISNAMEQNKQQKQEEKEYNNSIDSYEVNLTKEFINEKVELQTNDIKTVAICRKEIIVIQASKNVYYKYFIDTKKEMTSEEFSDYQVNKGCPSEETITLNEEQLTYINNK